LFKNHREKLSATVVEPASTFLSCFDMYTGKTYLVDVAGKEEERPDKSNAWRFD
jgi:hypothetical protein